MPYFQSHSGKVYYDDQGQGSPLVFIHGRTLDSRMWQPQVDFFKTSYRCLTYDLNGFGKSEIPSAGYDPVLTLKEFLNHLNLSKVTIISLSLGTHIAINFALEFPEYVEKLVLMSCTIPGAEFSQDFLSDWNSVENAGKEGNFDLARQLWLSCKAFSQLKTNNPANYLLFKEIVSSYSCWDIHDAPVKFSRPDVIARLQEIICPTLILSGDQDYPDFINNGKLLKQILSNSKLVTISHASHMVNLEFPDTVNQLILDFLKS